MHVIHGVAAGVTRRPEGERVRGSSQRAEMPKRLAIALDLVDEAFRYRFGGFGGDISPDFGEVGFRRVGQAEGSGRLIASSLAQ